MRGISIKFGGLQSNCGGFRFNSMGGGLFLNSDEIDSGRGGGVEPRRGTLDIYSIRVGLGEGLNRIEEAFDSILGALAQVCKCALLGVQCAAQSDGGAAWVSKEGGGWWEWRLHGIAEDFDSSRGGCESKCARLWCNSGGGDRIKAKFDSIRGTLEPNRIELNRILPSPIVSVRFNPPIRGPRLPKPASVHFSMHRLLHNAREGRQGRREMGGVDGG